MEAIEKNSTTSTDTSMTNSAASISTTSTPPAPAFKSLPAGYLAGGSMLDADGIMRPEYLDKYAEELAQKFGPMSASSFQRAFLSKAKEANKKKVPYSVKKNCAQGMVIQAMKLVKRKKDPAPAVLLEMIKAATATVVDESTFTALCMHLEAIQTYLMMTE